MGSARDYFDALSAAGRHHFTLAEALAALGGSLVAVRAALRRASQRGEVASPHRGFFVIVPPEYRRLRCLPAEQFVDQLMKFWEEPYYLGLLSAAERHGAAHQRPQSCQVIVRRTARRSRAGRCGSSSSPGATWRRCPSRRSTRLAASFATRPRRSRRSSSSATRTTPAA